MDYSCEKIVRNEQLYRLEEEQITGILHRSIGALTFLNKNKQLGMGSAFLISPNLILTAAHNVYDKGYNCQNEEFKFYLGVNGVAEAYYEIQSFRYPHELTTCQKSTRLEFDYALLKLKKLASYDKYLTLASPCQKCLIENNKQDHLQIFGYPAQSKENYEPLDKYASKFKLYQYGVVRTNRIILVDPQKCLLAYALSTLPGQSGSPVSIDNTIIAVHTGGGKQNQDFNVGRLVNHQMIENLKKWQKQLKGSNISFSQSRVCPHSKISVPKQPTKDKSLELEIAQAQIKGLNEKLKQQKKKNKKNEAIINDLIQQLTFLRQHMKTCTHSQLPSKKGGKEKIVVEDKRLQIIDVSQDYSLTQLVLSTNKLSEVNLRNNSNLVKLVLKENQIKHIDLRSNPKLAELYLQYNQITEIDLSKNTELVELSLYNNQLTHIDLTSNRKLVTLYIFCNKLDQIYLFENTLLEKVNVSSNKIRQIQLSTSKNISILNIHDNFLQMIDLSNNRKLTGLRLSSNQLKRIDLSNHLNLSEIYLNANNLIKITICYIPRFNADLADQAVGESVLQLVHQKAKADECKKWGQAKVQFYNNKKDYNRHKCKYSLKTIERG